MASNQAPDDARPESQPVSSAADGAFSIRIISPSTEIPSPLVLTSIQRSTTVGELKRRIQDAVPSKPSAHRQRLIHRGRMLADANEAMSSVFGQGTLDESPSQTLHLVLRPESGLMPPSMAQSRSEPGRTNANSDDRPASVPPPSTTPHPPPGQQQQAPAADAHPVVPPAPHPQPALPFPQGIPPQHLQHLLQHHQLAGLGQPPPFPFPQLVTPAELQQLQATQATSIPATNSNSNNEANAAQAHAQRVFQQHVNQQQRVRAAAGRHGGGGGPNMAPTTFARNAGERDATGTRRNHQSGEHRHRDGVPAAPGMATVHTRQTQVPHGQRWQVTVNETTMEFPASLYYPGMPGGVPGGNNPPNGHGGPVQTNAAQALNTGAPSIPSSALPSHQMQMPPAGVPQPALPRSGPTPRRMPPGYSVPPPHEPRRVQADLLRHHLNYMETLARRDQVPSLHLLSEASTALRALMADLDSNPRRESTPTGLREGHGHGHHGRHHYGRGRPHNIDMYSSTAAPPSIQGSSDAAAGYPESSSYAPVYLLSSPTGPYGLVSSPMGLYTTNPTGPMQPMMAAHPFAYPGHYQNFTMPTTFQQPFPEHFMHGLHVPGGVLPHHLSGMFPQPAAHPSAPQTPAAAGATQQQQPAAQQPQPQQPQDVQQAQQQQQQQAQQAQAQEENQVRELLRLLLPLGGHLWLLVRLLGFLFFFTGGSSWRRTVLIVLSTAVFFLAQAGYLGGLRNALWGPIQRHLERILPLADAPPPGGRHRQREGGAGAGAAPPAGNAAGGGGVEERNAGNNNNDNENGNNNNNNGNNNNPGATPTTNTTNQQIDTVQAAAQLLRQRAAERRRGWLVERLRGVERAIVVFLASLVPGVGERHIAARDAAAAAAARDAVREVIAGGGDGEGGDTGGVNGIQQEGQQEPESGNGNEQQGTTGTNQQQGQGRQGRQGSESTLYDSNDNGEGVNVGNGGLVPGNANGNGPEEGRQAAVGPDDGVTRTSDHAVSGNEQPA